MRKQEKSNHHYVSQCHLKHFLDENRSIYVYDKEEVNFYPKKTTKSLFSEPFSNSKVINGQIDHNFLEDELNEIVENNFNKHLKILESILADQYADDKSYDSLNWLSIIGVIGEFRHPNWKRQTDNIITRVEREVLSRMEGYTESKPLTKYQNLNTYYEMAISILERMGELKFQIIQISNENEFVIPDTSCFQVRGKLQEYFNQDVKELMHIGIPLTKKIFITCNSHLYAKEHPYIQILKSPSQELIDKINSNLIAFAYKGVACSNLEYLKSLISRQEEERLLPRY